MGKGQSNSFGRSGMGNGQFNSFDSSKPFENTSSFFGKTGYKPTPFKFTNHYLSQSGLDKYSNEMSRYNETWTRKHNLLLDNVIILLRRNVNG